MHIRGEDPQPDDEGAIPRRAKVEQLVIVKKIETQLLSSTSHSNHQYSSCHYEPEEPIPSPTMPPLEDPGAWHEYNELDAAETLLPIKIQAKVTRTSPSPDRHATAPSDRGDLAVNNTTRRKFDSNMGQQQNQNNDSSPPPANMKSHADAEKQDTETCDSMARSRL